MTKALLDHVSADSMRRQVPVLKPGYTVKVFTKIKEGEKFRIQIFEGLVIRINSGSGVSKTFTVRKMVDGIGVERIFPFFSPNIEKVEVTKVGKVRRAKLYFMRERSGKSARLRDMLLPETNYFGLAPEEAAPEEMIEELAETPEEVKEEVAVAEAPVAPEEVTVAEAPVAEEASEDKSEEAQA